MFPGMAVSIGDQVRVYRMRRGLTQEQLAHLVGRSERWLIDVDPKLSDALALAQGLTVEMSSQRRLRERRRSKSEADRLAVFIKSISVDLPNIDERQGTD